ncbi:lactate utilization protein [Chloroflexota bacterium]
MPNISKDIEQTLKSLKTNHFDARFARNAAEAKAIMLEMITVTSTIGVGDSVTLRQIGILDELSRRGNKVINPFTKGLTQDVAKHNLFIQTCRGTFGTDVFMAGCNAVTEDGKVVSVDYAGNRVAGTIFGGNKVILAIGRNKIVRNLDEAIYRIKNVIAPFHAKYKGRKTPCAVTGKCNDCDSSARICNVTIILEKKLGHTDLSVILIDEDLGLGWDPAWSEKRISKIKSEYCQNSWAFFTNEKVKSRKVPS